MADFDQQRGREMRDNPPPASDEIASDELDLRSGLAGLANLVYGSLTVAAALAQVAEFATRAIPGADGAGATVLRSEGGTMRVQAWAATADFVTEIDRLQYEVVSEGPCLTCMQTRRSVVSGSLGSDKRWPRFGGRVARLGVHASLSLPLLVHDEVVGAINCYARERDAFTEHAVRLGEQFSGPAAVAVHNAQVLLAAQTKADQLQAALTSRAVIDQAIGILRSRSGGSADEAFARLRQISQAEKIKLTVVAQQVVNEAVRRAHARHSGD